MQWEKSIHTCCPADVLLVFRCQFVNSVMLGYNPSSGEILMLKLLHWLNRDQTRPVTLQEPCAAAVNVKLKVCLFLLQRLLGCMLLLGRLDDGLDIA